MNKVIKLNESDLNNLVRESLTECIRQRVSEQLEKECVETLLECTAVAMLESLEGYVDTINENYTYTLNEAQLNETEENYVLNEVYKIYEKSFINECNRQLKETLTEQEANEIAPAIIAAARAVGPKLLGLLGKTGIGKAVGGMLGKIGGGIKNAIGGLGKGILGKGPSQDAANAGMAGGGNLMSMLKGKNGKLLDRISKNPGLLQRLMSRYGKNGMMGGMNGLGMLGGMMGGGAMAGLLPMLVGMMQNGNGGGMLGNLMNMFGGGNQNKPGMQGQTGQGGAGQTGNTGAGATQTPYQTSGAATQTQTAGATQTPDQTAGAQTPDPTAAGAAPAAQEGKKKSSRK